MHRPCPWEVGDVLTTENATPPSQRWPGTTWQQITDCFIRAADSSHQAGSTGGSWTHTQILEELASHEHDISLPYATAPGGQSNAFAIGTLVGSSGFHRTQASGGGQPMDITNKYRAAYIWKRTG